MRDYLPTETELQRNKTITHGVDTSIFYKKENNNVRNQIRKRYGIANTDILMINTGASTTNKGILLFLEALHILVNKMGQKHFKLMIKGSQDLYNCQEFIESYFQQFKAQNIMNESDINNLFTNGHVIFTKDTLSFEMINNLYNAADLHINPYLAEGFSLCSMESITAGTRVLVPRTGSTEAYIDAICENGGKEYVNFVDSVVVKNAGGQCQNKILVSDLVNTILNIDFKKELDIENYKKMISFIEKELSWNHVSTLLFDYFNEILKETN